ncbi:hypothetical protein BKI52_17780 [marine bacterium AO1-C]|nr:hypothetical protein BKI52_17780 [marine bacterium AO1-C]
MNNLEQKSQTLWAKFSRQNQDRFWPYYEELLDNAKARQVRETKIQVFNPSPPPQISNTPPTTIYYSSNGRKKLNPFPYLFSGLIFLFFLVHILDQSGSSLHESSVIVDQDHFQEIALRDRVKWQEDWLKTQLTSTQLDDYRRFMHQTELPRSKAIPKFIKQNNLVDWSQSPINIHSKIEDDKVYLLFKAGEKSILYGKYKGKYQRVTKIGDKYGVLDGEETYEKYGYNTPRIRPLSKVYQASLELAFNQHKVVHKKDGYYIVDSFTQKAEKVVKGGEQAFSIRLVIKKIKG